MVFIYIVLTLFLTCLGTISGMGGGVVLKPVMDAIGEYDAATVSILCSITVFFMATVSLIKAVITKNKIEFPKIAVLGLGSAGGGLAGQILLESAVNSLNDDAVKLCQNVILGALIVLVFIYSLQKNPKQFKFKNIFVYMAAGIVLGIISSFIGIGGGPMNVAAFMLLFGMDIKKAAVCSLITIAFSQTAKILTVTFTTGFGVYNYYALTNILPYMIAAAVIGSVAGIFINRKLNEKKVVILFNFMQILVMAVVAYNIISLSVNL